MSINPTAYPTPSVPEHSYDNQAPSTSAPSRKKRGVAFPADLWPQHSTLKISMMGMTPEQEQFTKNNINKWAPHVNLTFEFTNQPDADIRISVDKNPYGGASELGVNAKRTPPPKPTMYIGFANGDTRKATQTVLHEFGHALGLVHEHHHPYNSLEFNKENVYKDYEEHNQTREEADQQIFRKFSPRHARYSHYDQRSIMHYGMPGHFFNNNTPTPDNYELSETDKQFISAMYPKNR